MITVVRIVLLSRGTWMKSHQIPPSWLHHLPGSKNQNTGFPAPNAHIRTGYSKTYPSLTMGLAVPREHYCVWANVTKSQSDIKRNTFIISKTHKTGLAALWLNQVFLISRPVHLSFYQPDWHDPVMQRHTHTFLLPQFHYLKGPVGTFLLAQ